jgi:hypothetical protein
VPFLNTFRRLAGRGSTVELNIHYASRGSHVHPTCERGLTQWQKNCPGSSRNAKSMSAFTLRATCLIGIVRDAPWNVNFFSCATDVFGERAGYACPIN